MSPINRSNFLDSCVNRNACLRDRCDVCQKPTALAKILGVYRIGYRNTQTNAALKQDLLVMENLFYGREITQVCGVDVSVTVAFIVA